MLKSWRGKCHLLPEVQKTSRRQVVTMPPAGADYWAPARIVSLPVGGEKDLGDKGNAEKRCWSCPLV